MFKLFIGESQNRLRNTVISPGGRAVSLFIAHIIVTLSLYTTTWVLAHERRQRSAARSTVINYFALICESENRVAGKPIYLKINLCQSSPHPRPSKRL